jgi:geranylgeranyl diphosphate synthase, type II
MVDLKRQMMIENPLLLEVPPDNNLRDEIRRESDLFFSVNKIIPPVSYTKLGELADKLIVRHNWSQSCKAFIMVCGGNAVWRSVVGTIPFNRRMLLLPQCLRNSRLCKAGQDELGLLCSECGNCSISGILREAESLGYITIVSEGTTVASRLVESGNVDAIIGVGCMAVLQKMFNAVTKYSVPSIGIPLLSCGCIDTKADAAWINHELYHLDNNSGFKLLNINNLTDKTASLFKGTQIDNILGLSDSDTDKIVSEIMSAGGKRIRPLLTVLGYEAFSPIPDQKLLQHLAMSVECFHKASLVHDDIEDNDLSRYGKETIHARYGVPVAINIGDLLIGEGYRLLAQCGLEPHILLECIKIVSDGHRAMSVGQGTELMARTSGEILPLKDILTIFENKTSAAFKVSLLVGAIAGGADKEALNQLDQFSYLVGIAYQLKDDLEDFMAENDSDSFQTHSALISMLAEMADESDRLEMQQAVLQSDRESLQILIEKYSIREQMTDLLKDHLLRIACCLENIQNLTLKLALNEIVGKTFKEYN